MAKKRNRRERREQRAGRSPRPARTSAAGDPALTAEERRELSGGWDNPDGEGAFPADRVDGLGTIGDIAIYEGELEAGVDDDLPGDPESLELLTELELRDGETEDAYEAAEEGLTYVPPIDPPTVPGGDEGAEVASGFGASSLDEPYDEDHHSGFLPADDEMSARVHEALRADSSTTAYVDAVRVSSSGGRIVLLGTVDDLEDADNIVAVASDVSGVAEVVDKLVVRALEGRRS